MRRTLALVPRTPCRYERRDSLGRRIGYNWWREYNTAIIRDYNDAIDALAGQNHQMEPDEFRAAHPKVTLKETLLHNAGMHRAQVA